jgi:EAL domain-containing protein (putative c-di-GMP-specific phosphodiesterase class I)
MHARPETFSQRLTDVLGPGQIVAYFQPKFRLDRRATDVEALARWRLHDGHILTPEAFLPACRELGLEEELTMEMISQSCAAVAGWQTRTQAVTNVSINLTSGCVTSTRVFDHLRNTASRHGLSHGRITVEILEDALDQPTDIFLSALDRFRRTGFRLSIDDFGTGAAGLRRLMDFQAHEVKIARCFISGVSKDVRQMALVTSVMALADQLDMDIVIEGIDDQDDLAWCQNLRHERTLLQGFSLARPMALSQLVNRQAMAA